MNRIKYIILFLFAGVSNTALAGGDILEKVTDGVCNCLQESKESDQSIKTKQFQSCIEKVAKPYAKQLKKLYLNKNEPDAEQKFAEKMAMKLGMEMATKCPDMLEYIMEEFPELQDNN